LPTLRDTELTPAFVPRRATFREAARALFRSGVSAIAVLGDEDRVVGLFTDDDVLRGLFPGYLGELKHTAFLRREPAALAAGLEKAGRLPVERFMRKPMTVEIDTSALHVAERFLHCPWGALAVVEDGRFVGMVDQLRFVERLLEGIGLER
jgi:CBS domain-containing protein